MIDFETTIAAISTPSGVGGIAVVRVSGKNAFHICDQIFTSINGNKMADTKGYHILFGKIFDGDRVVDEVLVSIFRNPNSFTGENTVEISCHGSLYVQQEILRLLLKSGAVLASPGEFTQRAFMNGKLDLSQAEAVADLIASKSEASHRLAINQLRGSFSSELSNLRNKLLTFTSLVELELDFSEEEVEFANRKQLTDLAVDIHKKIENLAKSFRLGNAIKNGIPVTIVGETNVGKSTLLNRLLHEDKAIVSDIHGTTRDVIEDTIVINGILFRFIDTAGIRETNDTIENLGIEKTYQKMAQAEIVLWVIDARESIDNINKMAQNILSQTTDKKLLVVINKNDLVDDAKRQEISLLLKQEECVFISAKKEENIQTLEEKLYHISQMESLGQQDIIVTNMRHYEALCQALTAIERVEDGLNSGISGDFLSQDIRECSHYLGEITGEITNDEVLGNIFSHFCIGK